MAGYVALLRGVNVGGHRKVPMAELRELMAGLGWEGIRTHLQSGNAVFSAEGRSTEELAAELERAVGRHFGFEVGCLVRTGEELRGAMERCPFPAAELDPAKLLVLFLSEPLDPVRLAPVDPAAYAPDEFQLVRREIFCWFPGGMGRSKLPGALAGAAKGLTVTGRNWRTVSTLAELVN
ncbi:DUF1697 domain-containing protein [Streptomyces gobiensis]|uniref:DUF1697 domain-containing protein n=1 Tax=Streptomyces gobiensis TaxID=2875706 RepID=UPI001E4E571A|nr:DUF1697 domain-containing protein [Streptomyces gobiensis]UGY94239.1 DUF1697 domain-containing protein [Streptomyces gobiensis]